MPPRTAIQARRSLGANPVPSRSGGSYGGGEDFGSPYKDEDKKYTPPGSRDEGNVNYGGGSSENRSGENLSEKEKNELWNKAQTLDEINKEKEKVPLIDQFDNFMTSFGQNKINIPQIPSFLSMGTAALEGLNAKKTLLSNLKEGELSREDRITLANLLALEKNQGKDFITKEATDINEDLFNTESDAIVRDDYDEIIKQFTSTQPSGFKESLGTMVGDLPNLFSKEDVVIPATFKNATKEELEAGLGRGGLEYLRLTRPDLFLDAFGLPQTSSGLEQFANMDIGKADKKTSQLIMEARERLAQSKESQDRASGIMTASSAPPVPPPVIPPVIPPAEDEVPENPILNPVMSQKDPFNLAQFYASLPQYTQQGVMSPSLMQYYRNLGLFPRA